MSDSPLRAATAAETEGRWTPRLVIRLVALILVGEFAFMVYAFPSAVLPIMATEFQTDQVIWVIVAGAIGCAAFAPLLGRLADLVGKRKIILITLVAGTLGALIIVVAPNFGFVILGRVLQGFALGLAFMNASLVRDLFPARLLSVATALVATGTGLFSIGAALTISPIIHNLGWRGVFWIPAIYAVVMIFALMSVVPESPVRAPRAPLDIPGAILLAAALVCILTPISLGGSWGWTSPLTLGVFGLGITLAIIWFMQARRAKSPVIAVRDFSHAPLLLTLLISTFGLNAMAVIFQTWGYVIATPTAAGLGYGLNLRVEDIALFVSLYSLFSFIGGFTAGRALRSVRPGLVTIAIFLTGGAGFTVAALSFTNVVSFSVGAALIALAGGSVYALVYTMVALNVRPERQASTAAAVTVGGNIGGSLIPVIWLAALNASATYVDGAPIYTADALQTVFVLSVAVSVAMVGVGLLLLKVQRPPVNVK